ncbi:MAG: hypothetical protein LUG16_08565 [Candidatus Gastranaerophilales bacterium]|nr:hypothetical protein [Candidatus Gastranaerophilales bacterium]
MKKIISILLILLVCNTYAFGIDFDSSIDTDIRKEFGVDENNLPPLPEASADENYEIQNNSSNKTPTVKTNVKYNPVGKNYTVSNGTRLEIVSLSMISDTLPKGTKVSFKAKNGFTTTDGTIVPAGTIVKGTVTDSHRPQITGNGGLVELKINEIYFNGIKSDINTKVSLANSKKVFRSDIKGKRLYKKNFSKIMTPGKKFFAGTRSCASAMSIIPVVNIIAFVPLVGGAVFYTLNLVAAPFITFFTKGGSVRIPAGTDFEIKFHGDSVIKG